MELQFNIRLGKVDYRHTHRQNKIKFPRRVFLGCRVGPLQTLHPAMETEKKPHLRLLWILQSVGPLSNSGSPFPSGLRPSLRQMGCATGNDFPNAKLQFVHFKINELAKFTCILKCFFLKKMKTSYWKHQEKGIN